MKSQFSQINPFGKNKKFEKIYGFYDTQTSHNNNGRQKQKLLHSPKPRTNGFSFFYSKEHFRRYLQMYCMEY